MQKKLGGRKCTEMGKNLEMERGNMEEKALVGEKKYSKWENKNEKKQLGKEMKSTKLKKRKKKHLRKKITYNGK